MMLRSCSRAHGQQRALVQTTEESVLPQAERVGAFLVHQIESDASEGGHIFWSMVLPEARTGFIARDVS